MSTDKDKLIIELTEERRKLIDAILKHREAVGLERFNTENVDLYAVLPKEKQEVALSPPLPALYYGCFARPGHFLWAESSAQCPTYVLRSVQEKLGVNSLEDFCPVKKEGDAVLRNIKGHTILSFADYSVDTRPGSHSTFILPGIHDFDDAVDFAQTSFPWVWGRFRFKVELAP